MFMKSNSLMIALDPDAPITAGPELRKKNDAVAPTAQPVTPAPVLYSVWDTLASSDGSRQHDIITRTYDDGREPEIATYSLMRSGDGTKMPMEHALKFLSDKAFVVKTPQGDRIMPPASDNGGFAPAKLEEDQTIAYFSELSKPALFKRCKLLPGSERIQGGDDPQKMIAFLKDWRLTSTKGTQEPSDADIRMNGEGLDGMVDAAVLSDMIKDSPLVSKRA